MTETGKEKKYSFKKEERLCSLKAIGELFASGERFSSYPLFVVYKQVENKTKAPAVLFSVSKKRFKRAVDRNRIKRLMRESYRLNKPKFCEAVGENSRTLNIAFVYIENTLLEFGQIEAGIKRAMEKITKQLG